MEALREDLHVLPVHVVGVDACTLESPFLKLESTAALKLDEWNSRKSEVERVREGFTVCLYALTTSSSGAGMCVCILYFFLMSVRLCMVVYGYVCVFFTSILCVCVCAF